MARGMAREILLGEVEAKASMLILRDPDPSLLGGIVLPM
jgi:hypothetical protein